MEYGHFLIPTTYASDGKLPLDYKLTFCKIDKRTRFWRFNATRQVDSYYDTVAVAERTGMKIFRDENNLVYRILAPNSQVARDFRRSVVYQNQN